MENREIEKDKLLSLLSKEMWGVLANAGCFVAGGAITSLFTGREINDIDVYLPSKEALKNVLLHMYNEEDDIKDESSLAEFELSQFESMVYCATDKAVTAVHNKMFVQLICFDYFSSAEKVFDSFDFTACMGAYDVKNEKFILHPDFLYDNSARRLRVNTRTSYPFISVLRVQKYIERGWKISTKHLMLLLLACNKLKIETWEAMKNQVGGMYGYQVDEIFDDSVPFTVQTAIEQLSRIRCETMFKENDFKSLQSKELFEILGIEDVDPRIKTNEIPI